MKFKVLCTPLSGLTHGLHSMSISLAGTCEGKLVLFKPVIPWKGLNLMMLFNEPSKLNKTIPN